MLVVEDLLELRLAAASPRAVRARCISSICSPMPRGGPAEVGLEDLPDVHAGRNAERVQHDVDRRAVLAGTACPLRAGCGETTPLLPWRPAILSPTDSLRLMAT